MIPANYRKFKFPCAVPVQLEQGAHPCFWGSGAPCVLPAELRGCQGGRVVTKPKMCPVWPLKGKGWWEE